MGMFSSSSIRIPWQCTEGHPNVGIISSDEDPLDIGDTKKFWCGDCNIQVRVTITALIEEI